VKLPLDAALAATAARVRNAGALPAAAAVTTDTRALAPGDLFLALRGERFDGHAFVRDALAAGAAGVIVSDPESLPPDAPALIVEDTLAAYQTLGGLARELLPSRVVAITGSAGKTTTKELTAQLLAATGMGPVAATAANENNEIGVPKLFLGARGDERTVVAEMGARKFGDIAPLVAIARPDVALVTNIGEAHLEIMGSRERLAETKFGIFASGALPVLNLDDEVSCERAGTLGREPVWFAARPAGGDVAHVSGTARALVVSGRDELVLHELGRSRRIPITCTLPGEHNLVNLAGALAAAWVLGADPLALAAAIPSLALPAGRYERRRVGEFALIYDAYNASPAGVVATLTSFAAEPATRKIVVLGSMAELGPEAPQMHRRVGAAVAALDVGALLVGGDFAEDLAAGARAAGVPPERITEFADNAAALEWLRANVRAGDLLLLKASRRYRLEEILSGLEAAHV
jgi:UDP-N-acetylmuramoyl-tripeptide--D-alanyl-D-alanine ligase